MKHFKFLSLFLTFSLIPSFTYFPISTPNCDITACEENPCDFIFNDD